MNDPKTAQQIMGYSDLKTTMICVEQDAAAQENPVQLVQEKMAPTVARLTGEPWQEWCFPLAAFGLKAWDVAAAAQAWRDHLRGLHPALEGQRQRVVLTMIDLGIDCVTVEDDKVTPGRRIRTRHKVWYETV